MNGTIFDLIETEPSAGQEGFFELAESAPMPEKKSYLSSIKNKASEYGKTALKGGVEGLYRLGRAMGPLILTPQQKVQESEQLTEKLNEFFPTKEEGLGQRGLRRGLREAPTVLGLPGSTLSTLPRALAAGFLGEGAKDLGLPEWAQTAAEITAYIGPDVTKKLLETGKNKELIQVGKKLGLSDKELTPLIQSEFKQKWLTKISPKRGSTQKALSESKNALSESYSTLKQSETALKPLVGDETFKLQEKMADILFEMPASVRNKIQSDMFDLFSQPVTGNSLMNFYADVNHALGSSSKQLTRLKGPIKEAIKSVSPDLSKDFEIVNDLYSKYHSIASKLKPNLTSDIINAAETLGIVGSVTMGHYPSLAKILSEKLARKVAQQMLINPHYQQLGKKMVVALNHNKYAIAKKTIEEFIKLVKTSSEAASKFEEVKDEELLEFFTRRQK